MGLSKEEIEFFKEMATDKGVPADERKEYVAQLKKEGISVGSKKTTKKKSKKKSKVKMSSESVAELKKKIKDTTGKTEKECEDIIAQYKSVREKTNKSNKKRVSTLKKKGEIIKGTDEKTADAVLETTKKEVKDKIEKEIKVVEKEAKKQVDKTNLKPADNKKAVEKKVKAETKKITKKMVVDTSGIISAITSSLASHDKDSAKEFLIKLRSDVDKLIKKYVWGGNMAITQTYNIAQSNMSSSSVNPSQFADGGKINTFNSEKDYENYLRKEGKPFDSVVIDKEEFIQDFYDRSGNTMTYRSKYGNQLEIENEDRYENGFGDSNVYINEGMYTPFDEEGNFEKGGTIIHSSDKYGSDYWIDNDGDLFYRPMGSNEEWSLVSEEAFSESEREEFDKEMKKLFGKKINFKKGGRVKFLAEIRGVDYENQANKLVRKKMVFAKSKEEAKEILKKEIESPKGSQKHFEQYIYHIEEQKSDFKKGGRLKSALMRDRKYVSEQEWEQRYSKGKNRPRYKKKSKFEVGGFIVMNRTDGFTASGEVFETREEAQEFVDNFPKRYEAQGYYRNNNLEKINPQDVELEIIDVEEYAKGGKIEVGVNVKYPKATMIGEVIAMKDSSAIPNEKSIVVRYNDGKEVRDLASSFVYVNDNKVFEKGGSVMTIEHQDYGESTINLPSKRFSITISPPNQKSSTELDFIIQEFDSKYFELYWNSDLDEYQLDYMGDFLGINSFTSSSDSYDANGEYLLFTPSKDLNNLIDDFVLRLKTIDDLNVKVEDSLFKLKVDEDKYPIGLTYAKGGKIAFRKLSDRGFDIIVDEGRFQVENDDYQEVKNFIDKNGYRRSVDKGIGLELMKKYGNEIRHQIMLENLPFAKGGSVDGNAEVVEVRYRGLPIDKSLLGLPVLTEEITDKLEEEFSQDLTFTPVKSTNLKPISYEVARKHILIVDESFHNNLLKGYDRTL